VGVCQICGGILGGWIEVDACGIVVVVVVVVVAAAVH